MTCLSCFAPDSEASASLARKATMKGESSTLAGRGAWVSAYCLQHCKLRATDLSPKASASAAYAKLVEAPAMKDFLKANPEEHTEVTQILRRQVMRALGRACDDEKVEDESRWKESSRFHRIDEFSWDEKTQRFVKPK